MGLRKAASYSKKTVVPYTRKSKRKNKAFVKTVPPQNVVKFSMGKETFFNEGKFPTKLSLITLETVQVRSNALEAARQFINKKLEKNFPNQYLFRVVPYPHHIQRENKMLTGAGADRMQTGMQLSFGKTTTRAAIVKAGEPLFIVHIGSKKAEQLVRVSFQQIKSKLPCRTRVLTEITKQE